MIKIWAKTILEEKITRSIIFRCDGAYSRKNFHDYIVGVCYELDIPTPVVLKSNTGNFSKFNVTRFKRSDFVDAVDFDVLVLENASDD